MNQLVEGIIIAERNYGDNDKILSIFDVNGEIIQVKASGVRKLKNKNRSRTQVFSQGTFDIVKYDNKFSVLKTASIEESYIAIKMDMSKYYYALYFSEMIYRLGFYNTLDSDLYIQYMYALKRLCENDDSLTTRFVFEFKVLDNIGLKPNFESCVLCGNTNVVSACPKTGGYVCNNCSSVTTKNYSLKTLAVLKALANSDFSKLGKITLSKQVIEQVDDFLTTYFEYHVNIKFNTKKFI